MENKKGLMTDREALLRALSLVKQEGLVMMLGTAGVDGVPEIKAMVKMKNDGINSFLFCSNTSSRRATALKHGGRACLYAYEYAPAASPIVCRGVSLFGKVELSWDDDLRRSLWHDFMTLYYPQGPLDPDFVVVKFTAERGNYYEGLQNKDFSI